MNKFKRFFARFLWKWPNIRLTVIFLSLIIVMVCETVMVLNAIPHVKNLALMLAGAVGFILSIVFFYFLVVSSGEMWILDLPEFIILKAKETLWNNPNLELIDLKALLKMAEETGQIDELKEWLKEFKEYNSLKENCDSLKKLSAETIQKINEMQVRKSIKEQKLGIC